MNIPKCILGVAWTSALIAITLSVVLFSLFDLGTLIEELTHESGLENIVIKVFAFLAILIWSVLWSSVILNCFYRSLRESKCGIDSATDDQSESSVSSTS